MTDETVPAGEVTAAEALVEINKAYRTFKAFEHFQKVLTALASSEQVAREAEMRCSAARAEEQTLRDALTQLNETIAEQQTFGQRLELEAKGQASKIMQAAEAEAKDTLAKLREQMKKVTDTAEARAKKALDEAVALEARRDAAAAELADVEGRLVAAREAFQRALSGA